MSDRSPIDAGEQRRVFMARVSAALGRRTAPREAPPPPDVDEHLVRLAGPGEDVPSLFMRNAEAVGMNVSRVAGADLAAHLAALLDRLDVRSIAVSVADPALRSAVTAADRREIRWRDKPGLEMHYDADAGVTDTVAAIAESGTIVVASGPGHSRGSFLVPPVHVAIVRVGDIVPDMIDFWARIRTAEPMPLPTALVMISGPSKTADIEGILITGVHGPGKVFVLVVG